MSSPRDFTTLVMIVMLVMTVAMAIAVAAIVYLVTHDSDLTLAPIPAVERADPRACDASNPRLATCPPGQYCRFDACVPAPQETLCGAGQSCRECECEEGLVCHRKRCTSPSTLDRTPLVCEKNPALAEAVKTLALKCASRTKTVGDLVSAGSCTTAEWEQLALEDDKFDLLLSAFPDRFAVHFPSGRPYLKRKSWPTPEEHAHYLEGIRRFAEPLRAAKQIFVIGRASPDGDAETNHLLALARIAFVENLLDLVVYEGIPETQRDSHRVRIRAFGLPTTRAIEPARYRQTYLADGPQTRDPIITADPDSLHELHRALDGGPLDRTTPGWQALFSALNRVVMVIPVPCLGDEYKPPLTVDTPEPPR